MQAGKTPPEFTEAGPAACCQQVHEGLEQDGTGWDS